MTGAEEDFASSNAVGVPTAPKTELPSGSVLSRRAFAMRLTLWAIVVAAAGAAFNWVFGAFIAAEPLYGLLIVAAPVLEIAAAVWLFLSARRSDAWSARRLGIAVGLAVAALLDGACWLIIAASL